MPFKMNHIKIWTTILTTSNFILYLLKIEENKELIFDFLDFEQLYIQAKLKPSATFFFQQNYKTTTFHNSWETPERSFEFQPLCILGAANESRILDNTISSNFNLSRIIRLMKETPILATSAPTRAA